ncbi:MAG: outer membrane beta-barrel protein [Flavobacteriales bacterium]
MTNNNQIDRLFRERLRDRAFQTDMSAWKDMEKMLPPSSSGGGWFTWKLWLIIATVPIASLVPRLITTGEFVMQQAGEETAEAVHTHALIPTDQIQGTAGERGSEPATVVQEENADMEEQLRTHPEYKSAASHQASTSESVKHHQKTNASLVQSEIAESTDDKLLYEDIDQANILATDMKKMDLLSFDGLEKQPDASACNDGRSAKVKRHNLFRRCALGAVLGANVSKGFLNTGSHRAPASIKPTAGIRCAFVLNEAVSFGVDAVYQIKGGLNSEIITTVLDNTQTLSQWTINTLETTDLHYLELPVYFNYRKNRTSVDLGVQYARLLAAYSKLSTVVQNDKGMISETNARSWQGKDGFASYDVAAILGINYTLNEKWDAGSRISFGLYDVTDDESFNTGTVIDKNLHFKVYLTYHLFNY